MRMAGAFIIRAFGETAKKWVMTLDYCRIIN